MAHRPRTVGRLCQCPSPTGHLPLSTSHHPLPTSQQPSPTAHLPPPTSRRPLPTSHLPSPTSLKSPSTAHFSTPTSHRPLFTAHFSLPTSHPHFPPPTSHLPPPAAYHPLSLPTGHLPLTCHNILKLIVHPSHSDILHWDVSICKVFNNCFIKANLYFTTYYKIFCVAYFLKFMWEGFF